MQLNWRSRFVYRHVLAPKNRIRRKTLGGNTFYGQAAQDLFVRTVLQELRDGTFLEFGSNDPISNNNTWFLEDRLGWSGIAVELEDEFVAAYNFRRKSPCFKLDAAKFPVASTLCALGVKHLDYLQIDLDPAPVSLQVLKTFPFIEYRPKVITFEHDAYAFGDAVKFESREILNREGYALVCSDVLLNGKSFEDWWVVPELWNDLNATFANLEFTEVLAQLRG